MLLPNDKKRGVFFEMNAYRCFVDDVIGRQNANNRLQQAQADRVGAVQAYSAAEWSHGRL